MKSIVFTLALAATSLASAGNIWCGPYDCIRPDYSPEPPVIEDQTPETDRLPKEKAFFWNDNQLATCGSWHWDQRCQELNKPEEFKPVDGETPPFISTEVAGNWWKCQGATKCDYY